MKPKKQKYAFKPGTRYTVPADKVVSELRKAGIKSGMDAQTVVDVARPEDAPLHPIFEWNDAEAAEKYRCGQARTLIRAVYEVDESTGKAGNQQVVTYVPKNMSGAGGGKYHETEAVVARPDYYSAALSALHQKMLSAQDSLTSLKQAAERSDKTDDQTMARIAIAIQAMQTASAAVSAIH